MEFITYEMFGAMGDGKTDDLQATCLSHAEANTRHLPVRAKEGALYYLSGKDITAVIQTDTDWTGARFIIDDRDCENYRSPIFLVASCLAPVELTIASLRQGQTRIENPTERTLHVICVNAEHRDFIRRGLNQSIGNYRRDAFVIMPDGTLTSPVSLDFESVTSVEARPVDEEPLFIRGGEFTTVANQAPSKYTYYGRNIQINRANVDFGHVKHFVQGETNHGAPYRGFVSIENTAFVRVHDCLFTAHKIYGTIAGLPVAMGSYDININSSAGITLSHCDQTTDIMDRDYWGLIGTNYNRDLILEYCRFSRFDAHCGIHNCTLSH